MTMMKRLSALVFLLALAAVPALMFLAGWPHSFPELTKEYIASGEFTAAAERSIKANFPLREELSNLAWNLRYRTGTKELDGYFITQSGSVIKNVGAPYREVVAQNVDSILTFADQTWVPAAYFTLIPTACAIKQDDLPTFATVYNQKNFIEDVYKRLGNSVTTVNTYAALLDGRGGAIYYNTEDTLSPQGGYLVYRALGAKLDFSARPMDQFLVEYVHHNYEGSLEKRFPYAALRPDVIPLYHFVDSADDIRAAPDYTVTHISEEGSVVYPALYRKECLAGATPLDVFLGGSEPIIRIRAANRPNSSLIVFGDATAKSYLPFLALHYRELCFVDVTKVTEELLQGLDLSQFDRALFAFSADAFMHSPDIQMLEYLW